MEHKKMDSDSSHPSGDDSVARFGRDVSSVPMVIRAAREMNRLVAEACNVNEQDLWIVNGPDSLDEAEKVLAAAGAPELLEALQGCMEYLSCIPETAVGGDDDAAALCRIARAAIARATGAPQ